MLKTTKFDEKITKKNRTMVEIGCGFRGTRTMVPIGNSILRFSFQIRLVIQHSKCSSSPSPWQRRVQFIIAWTH